MVAVNFYTFINFYKENPATFYTFYHNKFINTTKIAPFG